MTEDVNKLSWAEIGSRLNLNKDVVRMRAVRSGLNKEQIYQQIKIEQSNTPNLKNEQTKIIKEQELPSSEQQNMNRTLSRQPFAFRRFSDTQVQESSFSPDFLEKNTQSPENQYKIVQPEPNPVQKNEPVSLNRNEQIRQSIDEWMIENTGKITAVLKSNFLSVVVMLTLSIVVATVFTSRVALAVGVQPFFAYSIAILVDVSAIIFMFRGKKWLSWVFGLNIFLQIALTSESTLAKLWFSADTILGLKVALLATAVLTAIEGFSSLSSQNKD